MTVVRHVGFPKTRLIGLLIFYHCTKFGATILIDAQIMAEIEIQVGVHPPS